MIVLVFGRIKCNMCVDKIMTPAFLLLKEHYFKQHQKDVRSCGGANTNQRLWQTQPPSRAPYSIPHLPGNDTPRSKYSSEGDNNTWKFLFKEIAKTNRNHQCSVAMLNHRVVLRMISTWCSTTNRVFRSTDGPMLHWKGLMLRGHRTSERRARPGKVSISEACFAVQATQSGQKCRRFNHSERGNP